VLDLPLGGEHEGLHRSESRSGPSVRQSPYCTEEMSESSKDNVNATYPKATVATVGQPGKGQLN
jgi:hypothetical protein